MFIRNGNKIGSKWPGWIISSISQLLDADASLCSQPLFELICEDPKICPSCHLLLTTNTTLELLGHKGAGLCLLETFKTF